MKSGSAYVFERFGGLWSLTDKLIPSDAAAWDKFGRSVSVSGRYAVIGAYGDADAGYNAGAAYVFNVIPGDIDTDGDGEPDATDPDDDNDGICDSVDLEPLCPSGWFSDGWTTGFLWHKPDLYVPVEPADLDAIVCDSPFDSPDDGVIVISGSERFYLNFDCFYGVADSHVFSSSWVTWTCGSLHVRVDSGSSVTEFTIDEIPHEVVVNEGGSVTFEDAVDESGELQGMSVIAGGADGTVTMDDRILTPGETVGVGDCATLLIQAAKHTVGSGSHPGSTKNPLVGVEVCAYDKSEGSCVMDVCGGISHQHYECIALGEEGGPGRCEPVNCCTTDVYGECTINLLPPGDYIVISADATKTVLPDPLGVSASDLVCGELKQKHLQQIVKADGKKVPGKTTRRTGSELLIIEPEFVVWDDTQQLYPFVFDTVGDWNVSVSVAPPEGFVADQDELSEQVDNALEAVQFTITELGSELVPTETTFEISHKGRRETVHSRVGIMLTPEYARGRGFDVAKLRAKGLIKENRGKK